MSPTRTRFREIGQSLIFLVLLTRVFSTEIKTVCDTRIPERNTRNPEMSKMGNNALFCVSAQPINWIIHHIPHNESTSTTETKTETEVERPFQIETKRVACDNRETWRSLSTLTPNATIPHYFTSNFTLTKRNSSFSHKYLDFSVFCGVFTSPTSNLVFLQRAQIELFKDGGSRVIIYTDILRLNTSECDDIILDFDESTGKCGCGTKSETQEKIPSEPQFFPCKDLISCRILSDSKLKSACEAKRVENRCNVTSFSLAQSLSKGGILSCPSANQNQAPYFLFFPMSQKNTTDGTENNTRKIQILRNDSANYEQFLNLVTLRPQADQEITRKTGVEIQCKGPAFIFLLEFLWTVEVDDADSKSNFVPDFTVSGSKLVPEGNGEIFVTTTLMILPDTRNTSSDVNVVCQAQVNDRIFSVESNLTVTLEVHKPKIHKSMKCPYGLHVDYQCYQKKSESDDDLRVTWHNESGHELNKGKNDPDRGKSFTKCPNETLTCVATLPNGVKSFYSFTRDDCIKFAKEDNCTGILDDSQTTPRSSAETLPSNQTDPDKDKEKVGTGLSVEIIAIIGIVVGLIFFLAAFVFILYKYLQTRKELRLLTSTEIDEFVKGDPDKLKNVEIQGENVHLFPFDKKYEVSDSDYAIDHENILGSGEFGIVYGGTLREIPVAIKTTKSAADVEFFKAFLKEIKVMTFLGKHQNVVQLLGTVTNRIRERTVFEIVELGIHGSLHSFLRKHQNNFLATFSSSQFFQISSEQTNATEYLNVVSNEESTVTTMDLVKWCGQIASGMSHLASKKIIHGDLAARNILLFDDYTAKITDFGLARQLYTSPNYVKKHQSPLPWRIMAPESLKNMEFSTKSDVWSFGVLAWEIFSLAAVPYSGLNWSHDFVDQLEQDLRLQKPKWATNQVYKSMCDCWNPEITSRPEFDHLETFYNQVLQNGGDEFETIYLELP